MRIHASHRLVHGAEITKVGVVLKILRRKLVGEGKLRSKILLEETLLNKNATNETSSQNKDWSCGIAV